MKLQLAKSRRKRRNEGRISMAIARIDTSALVDQSSFGKSQVWIFLLCFMAMIVDGYDLQIIGVAAAGIREALSLEPTVLGLVITAGQVGVILGALVLAPFADRVGRVAYNRILRHLRRILVPDRFRGERCAAHRVARFGWPWFGQYRSGRLGFRYRVRAEALQGVYPDMALGSCPGRRNDRRI
jgi:hypothetical protein